MNITCTKTRGTKIEKEDQKDRCTVVRNQRRAARQDVQKDFVLVIEKERCTKITYHVPREKDSSIEK